MMGGQQNKGDNSKKTKSVPLTHSKSLHEDSNLSENKNGTKASIQTQKSISLNSVRITLYDSMHLASSYTQASSQECILALGA